MTGTDKAFKYAQLVNSGEIQVNKFVKMAVNRFYKDYQKSPNNDYPYFLCEETANAVCEFISLLKLTKAVAHGTKFELELWQCFVVVNIFGWLNKKTGLRRFNDVYIEIPKKNGKTTLAAAIGLVLLLFDNEPRADVYAAAYTADQASICFDEAVAMIKGNEDILEFDPKMKIQTFHIFTGDGGEMRYVSNDANNTEGKNSHGVIFDEYHVHPTDKVRDSLQSGMAAREQPMLFTITTAGVNRKSPCYTFRASCINILKGLVQSDSIFTIIFGLDDGDDWKDSKNWIKANPNFEVSVKANFLESQFKKALQSGTKEVDFKTKHLNVWTDAAETWIPHEKWLSTSRPNFVQQIPPMAKCYGGLDLASVSDMTAFSTYFPVQQGIEKPFLLRYFFVPEAAVEKSSKGVNDYTQWVKDGHLIQTPGETIDYQYLINKVTELNQQFDYQFIAYDRYNYGQVAQALEDELGTIWYHFDGDKTGKNVPKMHAYGQGYISMSTPAKEYEVLYLNEAITHDGNPVHGWMMGNVAITRDASDNIKPDKSKSTAKIDGVVSDIMAIGVYLTFFKEEILNPTCY